MTALHCTLFREYHRTFQVRLLHRSFRDIRRDEDKNEARLFFVVKGSYYRNVDSAATYNDREGLGEPVEALVVQQHESGLHVILVLESE